VSHSENWLPEDGSNRISLIDRATGSRVGQIEMRSATRDTRAPLFPSRSFHPRRLRSFLSWARTRNSVAGRILSSSPWGTASDGKTYLFSGNAGTEDVAVMDLQRALAGVPVVEVAPRVPVQSGAFRHQGEPDTASSSRVTGAREREGRLRRQHHLDHRCRPRPKRAPPGAELARVRVGTDDPAGQARPFTLAWTPDGAQIIVANYRTNNVSISRRAPAAWLRTTRARMSPASR